MNRHHRFTARCGDSNAYCLEGSGARGAVCGGWLGATITAAAVLASAARADDLPPAPDSAPGNVPNIDATYVYTERPTRFRVQISGAAITRDQGGANGVEHRFIDNNDPKWQATVSIKTQDRKPNGKDSISWGVSKLRHLVVPPGHPDKAMGDEDAGIIRAFDATNGNILDAVAYTSALKDHSDGKNRHGDRYKIFYSQKIADNPADIANWELIVTGRHVEGPESKFKKEKNSFIDEEITKIKTVDLRVVMDFRPDVAAEANGFIGAAIEANSFGPGLPSAQHAVLGGGIADNSGITTIQQAVGVGYNQGVGISIAEVAVGQRPFVDSQMDIDQSIAENDVRRQGTPGNGNATDASVTLNTADIAASMTGAVRRNVGVTIVQQSAGIANNQHVGLSFAIGLGPSGVALSDAEMGQTIKGNTLQLSGGTKVATIADSIVGNRGITVVQQSSGSIGNQGVNIAVSGNNASLAR